MGYRTYYSVTIYKEFPGEQVSDEEDDLHEGQIVMSEDDYSPFDGECNWDTLEEDMKEYSLKYPDRIFCIYGEGDDVDDFYHYFFQNGKMQYCQGERIFEPYNPENFK